MLAAFISGVASESGQDEVLLPSPLGMYGSGRLSEADRLFDELIVTRRLRGSEPGRDRRGSDGYYSLSYPVVIGQADCGRA